MIRKHAFISKRLFDAIRIEVAYQHWRKNFRFPLADDQRSREMFIDYRVWRSFWVDPDIHELKQALARA